MQPDQHSLVADLIAALDPASEVRYRRQLAREAYGRGYVAGRADGCERAYAEMAAAWHTIARPVTRGPSRAELELKRWGPEGRARFADPRPGDYQPGKMA